MRPMPYCLQFRGFASLVRAGELRIRATSPSSSFITVVGKAGLSGHLGAFGEEEAVLESRLVFLDKNTFEERGTITVGRGNVLSFRTLDSARLGRSADPHLQQAATVLEIDGGDGQFELASGRIASTLLMSDTLDTTDHHLGLLFVGGSRTEGAFPDSNGHEWPHETGIPEEDPR